MPHHVLITEAIAKPAEADLETRYSVHRLYNAEDREALIAGVGPEVAAVVGGAVDAALMDRLPNLKIIANFGVGYDSIDTAAAKARDIRVTNTPSVLNDAMAEITIGLMVALARRIPEADRYVRTGKWPGGAYPLQAELNGSTVGILGLGRIGLEIAERCQAMKMRVVYHSRNERPNCPFFYYDTLIEMARAVDWLVVVTPGGKATRHLVGRQVLEALGPEGYLVNMARGSVVDEEVLVEFLMAKRIAGAALDVFENEPDTPEALWTLDNVVLSPHMGSATRQTRNTMGRLVVANIDAYFAGEPLLTPVV